MIGRQRLLVSVLAVTLIVTRLDICVLAGRRDASRKEKCAFEKLRGHYGDNIIRAVVKVSCGDIGRLLT
jgi:hypothetical protein